MYLQVGADEGIFDRESGLKLPTLMLCGNIHTKKLFRRKSFGVVRVVKKKPLVG